MVYGSIPTVRALAGATLVFEHGVKLNGVPDGVLTEFKIPAVGDRKSYIVDQTADKTSTITVADITVYVNGTPVTVSSIDEDEGSLILASAPLTGDVVTADYMWSEVSDNEIIEGMNIATEIVQQIIRGANDVSNTYTQLIDGNGVDREFEFEHADVTSVDTVTVNGTVLTENTDYYLYKHERTNLYWYIKFKTPPIAKEHVISIDYTYGELKYMYTRLANLHAARHVILAFLKPERTGGTFKKGQNPKKRGDTTKLAEINEEIIYLREFVEKRERFVLA